MLKKFIQDKLATQAKRLLAKTKPSIIAVTGSVGKSSAKQAIWAVLKDRFEARVSPKNYNTEFGLPLTVLDLPLPASKLAWFSTLMKGHARSLGSGKGYPKTLILEMAADKPGDLQYLCGIARPDVSVIMTVGESHVEFFKSLDAVAREKGVLAEHASKDGFVVLNRDDARVWAMRERAKSRVISFGFSEEADVRALEVRLLVRLGNEQMPSPGSGAADAARERSPARVHPFGTGECGTNFKIVHKGSTVPVFLPGVLGRQSVYAALAAAAVGLVRGMNLVDIAECLRNYEGPPGRMRAIEGVKHTVLIDDTYNASPTSAVAALETLRDLPLEDAAKRFAVLGDMLELGSLSVDGHERVGRAAVDCGIDYLVFVGERMGDAQKAALAAGQPAEQIFHFSRTEDAGRFVQEKMRKNDAVLVKGSRGMHMECVVKELMGDPMSAPSILVENHE